MSQELEGTLTNTANLVGTFGLEGGGGTSNYNDLINKPSINSVTLQGNKTASQLGFADVATSGNYDDLTNKPTIPAAQVNSDWNATSGVAQILNKPTVYQNAAELPVSSSDPTDTKTYIDTGLSGKQDKYWKQISSYFELTGNNTGTWSFTDDLSTAKYTDIMFCISLVNYNNGVRSSMSLSRLGFEAYGVFYDYTVGSDRMYFQISKATNNSFTVSGTNLGSLSSRVFVTAYYR